MPSLFQILGVLVRGLCQPRGCLVHTWNLPRFLQERVESARLTPFHLAPLFQVFVWVGKDSQEEEKTEALTSGEDPRVPVGLCHAVGWKQLPLRVWAFVTVEVGTFASVVSPR